MNILFQTVGTGGPEYPVWEALAHVCRRIAPDVLVQFGSRQSLETTIPKFEHFCSVHGIALPAEIRREELQDVDHIDRLLSQMSAVADDLMQRTPNASCAVDFTSGTKAMSAAVVALCVGRRMSEMLYAIGPRDDTGRATKTDKMLRASTERAYADLQLLELGRLFDQCQFAVVRDRTLALFPKIHDEGLRQRAASLVILADAYDHWNRFDWGGARARLNCSKQFNKYHNFLPALSTAKFDSGSAADVGWRSEALAAQIEHLLRCEAGDNPISRCGDLWMNAQRCVVAARYDDAVSRLYRLVEMMLQMRYCRLREISYNAQSPTSKVDPKWLRDHAPNWMRVQGSGKVSHEASSIPLGMRDLAKVLAEAGDEFAGKLNDLLGPPELRKSGLGTLLNRRNESLLAHGSVPIDEAPTRELLALSQELFEDFARCFNDDGAAVLAKAQFLACPWTSPGTR